MDPLPRRVLGRTSIDVTVLGYGAMELREPPRGRAVPEDDAARILNAVLDEGVNFIDTSVDYGASEERIGRHIAHRRDEYVLATKCGCVVGHVFQDDQVGPHDYRRENVVAGVEQSLRRLRTDRLDIVQVHLSPSVDQLRAEETLDALSELRDQGKLRFVGMSGTLPHLPAHIDLGFFDVLQVPYSALERDHEHLVTRARRSGAGVIVRGGVAKGVPARPHAPAPRAAPLADAWRRAGLEDILDGMTPAEFLLRYTISHPDLSTVIVGTVDTGHLSANAAAVRKGPLPADLHQEATRRLAAAGCVPKAG